VFAAANLKRHIEATNHEFRVEELDDELLKAWRGQADWNYMLEYVVSGRARRYRVDRTLKLALGPQIVSLLHESSRKPSFKSATAFFAEESLARKLVPKKVPKKPGGKAVREGEAKSAATKLLQYHHRFQDESCIYDSLAHDAVRALTAHGEKGKVSEDLQSYVSRWNELYIAARDELRVARVSTTPRMQPCQKYGSEFFLRRLMDKLLVNFARVCLKAKEE
jgi:hypothetical protein